VNFSSLNSTENQHGEFTPPQVSSKCPYVALGVVEWLLGYEERRCWANCPCN